MHYSGTGIWRKRERSLLYLCITEHIFFCPSIVKGITKQGISMGLQIGEITKLLAANVLTHGLDLTREVEHAFSSDLMSDVLTGDYYKTVLITGLSNLQAIRTAEMADISEVIIARGKEVSEEMIKLASDMGIILISSGYSMFRISGMLYEAGVKPLF
jgi:predicted transcriptional regulator